MNSSFRTIEEVINNNPSKDIAVKILHYNTNHKFNTFLYHNNDCNILFGQLIGNNEDRFKFVDANNKIERELIPYIHDNFNGVKCKVKDRNGNEIDGIIEHSKTRVFEGKTFDNTVSFRRRFEDATYSEPETIALWVVTMDKYSTHLYPITQIFIQA